MEDNTPSNFWLLERICNLCDGFLTNYFIEKGKINPFAGNAKIF